MNKMTETKYVSQTIQSVSNPGNEGYVRESLNAGDANTRLRTILPNLGQGVGSNQRIGTVITPVKVRVTIRYYVDQTNERAFRLHVRQFLLTSKSVKNPAMWPTEGDSQTKNLLDNGDGTNTFATYGVDRNSWLTISKPINKTAFTKLGKGNKTLSFGKQGGRPQNEQTGGNATTPYDARSVLEHTQVLTFTCPKLKYEQFVEQGLNNYLQPTNFNPLFGACGYVVSSEDAQCYRQLLGTISGGGIGLPSTPLIRYTIFSEMWFKDD